MNDNDLDAFALQPIEAPLPFLSGKTAAVQAKAVSGFCVKGGSGRTTMRVEVEAAGVRVILHLASRASRFVLSWGQATGVVVTSNRPVQSPERAVSRLAGRLERPVWAPNPIQSGHPI